MNLCFRSFMWEFLLPLPLPHAKKGPLLPLPLLVPSPFSTLALCARVRTKSGASKSFNSLPKTKKTFVFALWELVIRVLMKLNTSRS